MLSILIPTYNYDTTKLVKELHRQALEAMIDFEIIVMEDGSNVFLDENKAVADLDFCRYIRLEKNIGRSAIRNKLADTAKYEQLIFMDCDAEICLPDYIQRYAVFQHGEFVVIGGTTYDSTEKNPDYSLRLKYGRKREAQLASSREKRKYQTFATFNFLISKSIFSKIRFDESIRDYGHEDTLFGHCLFENGYEILHIDNPLIHKGLDDNRTFIRKTEIATENLYRLHKTGCYPFLANESKLLHHFLRLKKMKLDKLFALKFKMIKSPMKRQLSSKNPSLRLYDFYKLAYFCSYQKHADNADFSDLRRF